MPYYRVTFDGYIEGKFDTENDAIQAFIDMIENEEIDSLGRVWQDHISAEFLNE